MKKTTAMLQLICAASERYSGGSGSAASTAAVSSLGGGVVKDHNCLTSLKNHGLSERVGCPQKD